jgi:hypothetical protein
MVSKYGASRELIHFQDILDTQLPLITEFKCHDELQKDIEFGSKKFKAIIGKFMAKKAQSKHMYKKGISTPYLLHEQQRPSTPHLQVQYGYWKSTLKEP